MNKVIKGALCDDIPNKSAENIAIFSY